MEYEIERDEPASTAVVRAISVYTNTPVEAVQPLYGSIDPDALDCLVGDVESNVRVEFEHDGVAVTVRSDLVSLVTDSTSGSNSNSTSRST